MSQDERDDEPIEPDEVSDLAGLLGGVDPPLVIKDSIVISGAGSVGNVAQGGALGRQAIDTIALGLLPDGLPPKVFSNAFPSSRLEVDGLSWVYGDEPTEGFRLGPDQLQVLRGLHDRLRTWCSTKPDDPHILRGLRSLLALSTALSAEAPRNSLDLFRDLEDRLKDLGDFRLVLAFANLTIDATHRVTPRNAAVVELEAQAMTCGRAWIYQRTGRLTDATAELDRALHLNHSVGCRRGEAFTLKCRGRLHRMIAMRSDLCPTAAARNDHLNRSAEDLDLARAMFADHGGFTAHVGDSISLRARTALEMGDPDLAQRLINEARQFLVRHSGKAWLDLALLQAEVLGHVAGTNEVALRDLESLVQATETPTFVVGEIRARVLWARARQLRSCGRDFAEDYEAARQLCVDLDLHDRVAEMEWWDLVESGELSGPLQELLGAERPPVRIRAWTMRPDRASSPPSLEGAMALEAQGAPLVAQWEPIIELAREQDAIDGEDGW